MDDALSAVSACLGLSAPDMDTPKGVCPCLSGSWPGSARADMSGIVRVCLICPGLSDRSGSNSKQEWVGAIHASRGVA
jgi:hypothetical protein